MRHEDTPDIQPPRWADKLLEWRCSDYLLEEVQGDLYELFEERVAEIGLRQARRQYVLDVLGFLRPWAFKRKNSAYTPLNFPDMFSNYLKIALRNFWNQKVSSFINVFGLAVGMACCVLIGLYIRDENRYDRHWRDSDRIYRVAAEVFFGDKHLKGATLAAPIAFAMRSEFPQVEAVARLLVLPDLDKSTVQVMDREGVHPPFFEINGYMVDSSFFHIFSYPFTYGNPEKALKEPNTVVLEQTVALKLFGNVNPLDKTLRIGNKYGEFDYRVTGVFKSDQASHLNAHFFISMQSGSFGQWVSAQTNWLTNNLFYTYVKLRKEASPEILEAQFPAFMTRHAGEDMKATGLRRKLFLQAISDIHLNSNLDNEISPNGSITYLYILACIAGFTLLLACINFMNLATARSARRAREVGIRKVMGAYKATIVWQFLGESVLMSLASLILACGLVTLLLPVFNQLTGKALAFSIWQDYRLLGWPLGLTLLTGLLAGSYPAFYLSSFQSALVLKGKFSNSLAAIHLRRGLVVFQFVVSIGMVLTTLVINQQMHFLRNQHLGFEQHQQLVIPLPTEESQRTYAAFKEAIGKHPQVVSAASTTTYPGRYAILSIGLRGEGKHVQEAQDVKIDYVDYGFTETLGFELLAGRFFSWDFPTDTSQAPTAIVLNQTAVQNLGYTAQSAIGKPLYFDWQGQTHPFRIVGVVRDFHFENLHQKIAPFGFVMQGSQFGPRPGYLVARVRTPNVADLLVALEGKWKSLNPGTPFEYLFLDEDFQRNYQAEQRISQLVSYFTGIAILIACLGLYGLTAYTAEQRTKEIGIRKVLGASMGSIVWLLSQDFLKLVLVANVVAWPMAWWGANRWLEDFAYRIDISWWVFAWSGLAALLIAMLTVSYQAVKAALANPAKSLRTE